MQPQRESFQLRAAEIIYLTALIGGEGFPGLELNLEEHTEAKMRSIMDAQMKSLELKRYLEIDFMGQAQINETLHKFIETGSSCSNYIYMYIQEEQEARKIYYFTFGEHCFELAAYPTEDRYQIQEIYGPHELICQAILQIPLVDVQDSRETLSEAIEDDAWIEKALENGASITSLAEVQVQGLEGLIQRDLVILTENGTIWTLHHSEDGHIYRNGLSFSAVMGNLTLWLQEAVLVQKGAEHDHSSNNSSF
jgi:hypothetical protein